MRLGRLSAIILVACSKPTPLMPTTASTVYSALVEAGCMDADDAGLSSVQEEHDTDAGPDWFGCLWNGGTVSTCNVPCSASDAKHK